jgi:hypothetical protein
VEPDRWQQVAALCGEALEVPATDRTAFLRERCGDDQALRGEVESLLSMASKSDSNSFFPLKPNSLARSSDSKSGRTVQFGFSLPFDGCWIVSHSEVNFFGNLDSN